MVNWNSLSREAGLSIKWDQYDPEVPVSGEVFCETPPMRTYSFGIEVSF